MRWVLGKFGFLHFNTQHEYIYTWDCIFDLSERYYIFPDRN